MKLLLSFLLSIACILPLIAHENKLSGKTDHAKTNSVDQSSDTHVVWRSRLSAHYEEGISQTIDSTNHSGTGTLSPTKLSSQSITKQ